MSKEKRKINLVMLSVVIASVLTATIMPVLGYDQNNPATYTINYIIPSDTTFVITLTGAGQTMDFNPQNGNNKSVEPVYQNASINQPWATITNNGNVNLNFSTNLTAPNPTWVTLSIASDPAMTDKVTVTDIETAPSGWNNVPKGSSVNLYSMADFTGAPQGTESATIKINGR